MRSITIEQEHILEITRAVIRRLPAQGDLYFQDISSGTNEALDYCIEKLIRICQQGRLDKLILRCANEARAARLARFADNKDEQ